jgi:hypothetical protein
MTVKQEIHRKMLELIERMFVSREDWEDKDYGGLFDRLEQTKKDIQNDEFLIHGDVEVLNRQFETVYWEVGRQWPVWLDAFFDLPDGGGAVFYPVAMIGGLPYVYEFSKEEWNV